MRPASATENPAAMVVFLTIAISVDISGGTALRYACGSTTSRSVWPKVIPTARAASACPASTVLIPERSTSQMNADVYRLSAMTARWNGDSPVTPIFGRPKKQNTKISVSGVLRKMLTYTVPTARSTGTGDTRIAGQHRAADEAQHTGDHGQADRRRERVDEQVGVVEQRVEEHAGSVGRVSRRPGRRARPTGSATGDRSAAAWPSAPLLPSVSS